MRCEDVFDLVNGTAEAAYLLDPMGIIAAWNPAAEKLFGVSSKEAVGQYCCEVLHGVDECGSKCKIDCVVKARTTAHEPMQAYDVQVETTSGPKWCSMTVLFPSKGGTADGYTLHIAKSAAMRKRFEQLLRDFVLAETALPMVNINQLTTAKNSVTDMVDLSDREIEVLTLLSKGITTTCIAAKLFISPTTVNNHVQRILKKLSAHTRLEAVRRAERAGLI